MSVVAALSATAGEMVGVATIVSAKAPARLRSNTR